MIHRAVICSSLMLLLAPNTDSVLSGYLDQAHTACAASEITNSQDLPDDCLVAIQAVADTLEESGITPEPGAYETSTLDTMEILENIRVNLGNKHELDIDDWLLNQIYRKVMTYRSLTNRDDPIDHSTGTGIQP